MKIDNELIAEFMGYQNEKWWHLNRHEFDPEKYWDSLMPVVEKIQCFAHLKIENGQCFISVNGELIAGVVNGNNLENTYKAVVAYIKYYNNEASKGH